MALVMIPLPAVRNGAAVKARSRYISELIRLSVVLKLDPNSRILKKQPGDNDKSSGEFDEF